MCVCYHQLHDVCIHVCLNIEIPINGNCYGENGDDPLEFGITPSSSPMSLYFFLFFSPAIPCTEVHHGFARRWRSQGTAKLKLSVAGCIIYTSVIAQRLCIFNATNFFLKNIFLGIMQPILPGATTSFLSILDSDRSIRFKRNLSKWIFVGGSDHMAK